MRYNVIVWPRRSSRITFKELADSFVELLSKQFICILSEDFSKESDTTNIILGANDSIFVPREIPKNSIIVNLEQMGTGQMWDNPKYINLLKRYPVWDYSSSNIAYLKSLGVTDISKMEIGHTKSLETCAGFNEHPQTIDVLFFGAMNQRRKYILIKLKSMGYNVVFTSNTFGEERDQLIARSKIVLNIHYYESKILEVVRISHLLANKKCVISERGNEDHVNEEWSKGVMMCDYDEIVSNVLILLFSDSKRKEQEMAGYSFIIQHPLVLPI